MSIIYINNTGLARAWERIKAWVQGAFVPVARKVNNKALNADISLNAIDVGADALIYDIDISTLNDSGYMSADTAEPFNAISAAISAGKAVYVKLANNRRITPFILPLNTNYANYYSFGFATPIKAMMVDVMPDGIEVHINDLNHYSLPNGGIPKTDMAAAVQTSLDKADNAQEKLVSGTNIKTINNEPILGSGNLAIVGTFIYTIDASGIFQTGSKIIQGSEAYNAILAAYNAGKSVFLKLDGEEFKPILPLNSVLQYTGGTIDSFDFTVSISTPSGTIAYVDVMVYTNVSELTYSLSYNVMGNNTIQKVISISEADYNALAAKDSSTLYVITQ